MYPATCEAEAKSTSPTRRCPDFLEESIIGAAGQFFLSLQPHQNRGLLTWEVIRADIDNDSTGFYPVTLDELRLSDGGYQDIRTTNLCAEVVSGNPENQNEINLQSPVSLSSDYGTG